MSSVQVPIVGVRATAASILPASFLAGMITETLFSFCLRSGIGRATAKRERQSGESRGPRKRLSRLSSPKSLIGQRIRDSHRISSQPERASNPESVSLDSQLLSGWRARKPKAVANEIKGRQSAL